jgi:WbqC-like protein family
MLVAIHQPNFFPWLGYFDKIARADVFVLLDDVQFPKKGGTWTNRVQLVNNGHVLWATVPVRRDYSGVRNINDIQINDAEPWRDKLLRTLQTAYAKAPHFKEVFAFVEPLVRFETDRLAELNLHALGQMCDALGLARARRVPSSGLGVTSESTQRLIDIVRRLGGSAYLCGGGAGGYQEDAQFAAAGVRLVYQAFAHPTYPQPGPGPFTPGLSVLDALMSCGFDGTARLLGRGELRQAS